MASRKQNIEMIEVYYEVICREDLYEKAKRIMCVGCQMELGNQMGHSCMGYGMGYDWYEDWNTGEDHLTYTTFVLENLIDEDMIMKEISTRKIEGIPLKKLLRRKKSFVQALAERFNKV